MATVATLKAFVKNGKLLARMLGPAARASKPAAATEAAATEPHATLFLVLDKSGSMIERATRRKGEMALYSKMDIAKHGAKVIVEGARGVFRIAIVAFDECVFELLPPTEMDDDGVAKAFAAIDGIEPDGRTNMWGGIEAALKQCTSRKDFLILLTDGVPSSSPPKGEAASIAAFAEKRGYACPVVSIGFGTDVNIPLLKGIGGGEVSFIPDSSMVLNIVTRIFAKEQIACGGNAAVVLRSRATGLVLRTAPLGRVRLGQTRHALIDLADVAADAFDVALEVDGKVVAAAPLERDDAAVDAEVARCAAMDALRGAIVRANYDLAGAQKLVVDAAQLPALSPAFAQDLTGQVALALTRENWNTWGVRFVPALLSAHESETCSNILDPGVQGYAGKDFLAALDAFDTICEKIAPPRPSLSADGSYAPAAPAAPVTAAVAAATAASFGLNFGTATEPPTGCFAPDAVVRLAGGKRKRADELAKGDRLPNGGAIACVVEYRPGGGGDRTVPICDVRGVGLTARHPFLGDDGAWKHPIALGAPTRAARVVYNLVVTGGDGTVWLEGDVPVQACVLGHGITADDVITHRYLGTHAVVRDLELLDGWAEGLVRITDLNEVRDENGFIAAYVRVRA